nr:caspase-1-like isoform X2 [Nomia melanderi]
MFVLLLCVLSFTRNTIVYLSNTLFNKSDRRLQHSRTINENKPSEGTMDGQTQDNKKLQKLDEIDTIPTFSENNQSYDADYVVKPTVYVKSVVGKDDMNYNMNHKKRGRCVIFNNDKFEMQGYEREGSEMDVIAITRVFRDILGFEVIPHRNFTSSMIHQAIKKLSEDDYEEEDCLCVFILTHGSHGDSLHAHDCTYPLKSIWEKFTGDNCHALVGKPKLFFIQCAEVKISSYPNTACRGTKYDSGIGVFSSGNSQTDSVATTASYKIPTHADILLAHSTVEDFYSWRNETEGSFYIQELCDVIEEYWETYDLAKMLTITARIVANEHYSIHIDPKKNQKKQMPSITSTLTRDVWFTKKNS